MRTKNAIAAYILGASGGNVKLRRPVLIKRLQQVWRRWIHLVGAAESEQQDIPPDWRGRACNFF
jgi:hypothetical protein